MLKWRSWLMETQGSGIIVCSPHKKLSWSSQFHSEGVQLKTLYFGHSLATECTQASQVTDFWRLKHKLNGMKIRWHMTRFCGEQSSLCRYRTKSRIWCGELIVTRCQLKRIWWGELSSKIQHVTAANMNPNQHFMLFGIAAN